MNISTDFSYPATADGVGQPLTVSIFSVRPAFRAQTAEHLQEAGFHLLHADDLPALMDGTLAVLGDAVILDCPAVDARGMAALARLDMRIARSCAQLVVTTSLEALNDVFVCFDQSAPQILVDPSPAEQVVALVHALNRLGARGVCELSQDDRAALLHLTTQVEALARRLDGRIVPGDGLDGLDRGDLIVASTRTAFRGFDNESAVEPLAQPSLPDPRVVRELIRRRQARARFFDAGLFADPAWDMLLDLTAAAGEQVKVSVTSLCIASGVPATTALRWVRQMIDAGLLERCDDAHDKRRAFISLSAKAREAMARYFAEVGLPGFAHAA